MMLIPNEIKEEYAVKRRNALEESGEKKRALYAIEPRLEEIISERRDVLFEMGINLAKSDDKDSIRNETMHKVAALDAEEAEIYKKHGITAEYFEPNFSCKQCKDTGFTGDAEKKMCSCLKQKLLKQQYASSHISEDESFEKFDLEVFKKPTQRRMMEVLKTQMEEYCENFPNNEKKDVLIMGNAGLGKTYMLNCVAKRLFDKGFSVLKLTSYNLVNMVLENIRGKAFDFVEPDLLIIDDLGTEPMIPNITREHLFAVLNERQNAQKPTLIATNCLMPELQDNYGERLFSRIVAPRVTKIVKLTGDNIRMVIK